MCAPPHGPRPSAPLTTHDLGTRRAWAGSPGRALVPWLDGGWQAVGGGRQGQLHTPAPQQRRRVPAPRCGQATGRTRARDAQQHPRRPPGPPIPSHTPHASSALGAPADATYGRAASARHPPGCAAPGAAPGAPFRHRASCAPAVRGVIAPAAPTRRQGRRCVLTDAHTRTLSNAVALTPYARAGSCARPSRRACRCVASHALPLSRAVGGEAVPHDRHGQGGAPVRGQGTHQRAQERQAAQAPVDQEGGAGY